MRVEVVSPDSLGPSELERWSELQQQPVYRSPFFRPEFTLAIGNAARRARRRRRGRGHRGRLLPVRGPSRDDRAAGRVAAFELPRPGARRGRGARPPRARACLRSRDMDVRSPARGAARICRRTRTAAGEARTSTSSAGFDALSRKQARAIERSGRARQESAKARARGRPGALRPGERCAGAPRTSSWSGSAASTPRPVSATSSRDAESRELLEAVPRRARFRSLPGPCRCSSPARWSPQSSSAIRSSSVWHSWFPAYNRELSKYSPGLMLLLELASGRGLARDPRDRSRQGRGALQAGARDRLARAPRGLRRRDAPCQRIPVRAQGLGPACAPPRRRPSGSPPGDPPDPALAGYGHSHRLRTRGRTAR